MTLADPRLLQPVWKWGSSFEPNARWLGTATILILMIGARFEVGGDWANYEKNLHALQSLLLSDALKLGDPGYQFLSWAVLSSGGGTISVNLCAAVVFVAGLIPFCRAMPQPALALAIAIPYLVVVVAMGYTRQGMALGMAMLGLLALQRQRLLPFVLWILIGASFHKSAVLMLPIAALAAARNRLWSALSALVGTGLGYWVLLDDSVDRLITNYVEAEYQSSGAFIRLAMNALPAALLLRWRSNFFPERSDRLLWTWMAIISIGLLILLFISPSSTAVDRVALYMLPIQLAVLSRVPAVLGGGNGNVHSWTIAVLLYSATVQFVWLNFAAHSEYWLPYRFYPLELLLQGTAAG